MLYACVTPYHGLLVGASPIYERENENTSNRAEDGLALQLTRSGKGGSVAAPSPQNHACDPSTALQQAQGRPFSTAVVLVTTARMLKSRMK